MAKNDEDFKEINILTGGAQGKLVRPEEAPRSKMPEKPRLPHGVQNAPTYSGVQPPVPVVASGEIEKYQKAPKTPDQAFGFEKPGSFDKELNELALKEVADARGISVEQLLASAPDKILTKPLQGIEAAQGASPAAPAQTFSTDTKTRIAELELEIKRLELEGLKRENDLALSRSSFEGAPPAGGNPPGGGEPPKSPPVKGSSKKELKALHPLLDRLRDKLSLKRLKPAEVELEGLKFSLLPPPASMHPWVLGAVVDESYLGKESMEQALKLATAAVSVVLIEGVAAAEALGLVEAGSVQDPWEPNFLQRKISAQALYEMFRGEPTVAHLFALNPDVGLKLYREFTRSFPNIEVRASSDPEVHLFKCPIEGCNEELSRRVLKPEDAMVFCPVHGTEMTDEGTVQEVTALPLH
jgi:hypothetical protein